MVSHSLNNNTRTCLFISPCLNTNPLVSLIPQNRLKVLTFTQLWYYRNYLFERVHCSHSVIPMFQITVLPLHEHQMMPTKKNAIAWTVNFELYASGGSASLNSLKEK